MDNKKKDMKEIERRIYVSDEIFANEYSYVYGENKDKKVTFAYYQAKNDKKTPTKLDYNYSAALDFARYRANDKRYRNYEFFIY